MMRGTRRLSIAAFAVGLTAAGPAPAQTGTSGERPGREAGVGVSPFFLSYLDVESTAPASAWFTLPVGRFRLQADYLRSVRRQPLHYTGYRGTDDQGRQVDYDVAREDFHVEQVFSAAIKWPFPKLGQGTYLLIGGAWQHYTDRWCLAISPDDRPAHGARLDFPPGFDCAREPADAIYKSLLPLYGAGVDLPLGSRFFGAVQYRARLHPVLGELRVGAGVRF